MKKWKKEKIDFTFFISFPNLSIFQSFNFSIFQFFNLSIFQSFNKGAKDSLAPLL